MKPWIPIVVAALIIFILGGRLVIRKIGRFKTEKEWYVQQLKYTFSAEIDTVIMRNKKKGFGLIVFHLTQGAANTSVEDSLNRHLTHFKRIEFLRLKPDEKIEIISGTAGRCAQGDSISVNSSNNKIMVFREGNKVSETQVSESLRVRPI